MGDIPAYSIAQNLFPTLSIAALPVCKLAPWALKQANPADVSLFEQGCPEKFSIRNPVNRFVAGKERQKNQIFKVNQCQNVQT